MEVQFAGRDGKILYCNDEVVRITTPRKLFRKEEIIEFPTSKVMKVELYTGTNLFSINGVSIREVFVFWESQTHIVGYVLLRPKNIKLVEIILRFFKKRDAKLELKNTEKINSQEKKKIFKISYKSEKEKSEVRKAQIDHEKQKEIETFVAGTQYNKKNVKKIFSIMRDTSVSEPYSGYSNRDIKEYGEGEIYYELEKYGNKHEVNLVKEPDNEFDKNAIKVCFEWSGIEYKVGYVPKEALEKVHQYWDHIIESLVFPVGGKYKTTDEDDEGKLKVIIEESDYNLDMKIKFDIPIK